MCGKRTGRGKGGVGEGLIIKHGEIYKKVPEAELLPALRYELEHWSED